MNARTILVSFLSASLLSVSAYEIRLTAIAPDNTPESYATVRVFNVADSTSHRPVAGEITDSLGSAAITVKDAGRYRVTLDATGRQTVDTTLTLSASHQVADLGNLHMINAVNELAEVTVTAQKPLVTKEIDRISYDVAADPDAATFSTSEILRKVPMVNVDADGTITVNGSSSFLIYKNNRPSKMLTNNAKDILAAIPASTIRKIEVITEPGSKYDAEGVSTILNIITNNETIIKGVTGNVGASYNTDVNIPTPYVWLSSQLGKVTFSVNAGHATIGGKGSQSKTTSDLIYENNNHQTSSGKSRTKGFYDWFGFETSWEPDTLNLFTVEGDGYYYKIKYWDNDTTMVTDSDGDLTDWYATDSFSPYSKFFQISANANYQHSTKRKDETYTLSYQISCDRSAAKTESQYSYLGGTTGLYSAINSMSKPLSLENTLQFDWKRPFGKVHTLETGAKYISRSNTAKSTYEYVGWQTTDNNFKHYTDIAAVYAQYTAKVKKVSFRAGLRYEYTNMRARFVEDPTKNFGSSLNDIVPAAAWSWSINDANSLNVNYSSSIYRPGIWYLNPARSYNPVAVSYGNPDLESTRSHSMRLTYSLIKPKFNLNASAQFRFSNNSINEVSWLDNETGLVNSTYANTGKNTHASFSLYAKWTITKKTKLNINGSWWYDHYNQEGYKLGRLGYYSYVNLTQDLPYKFSAQLAAYLSNWGCNDVSSYNRQSFAATCRPLLSISWRGLKEDRLNLQIALQSFIGPKEPISKTVYVNGPYTGEVSSVRYRPLTAHIAVSYRFGSFTGYVKKTDKTISNDDVVGGGQKK